jgi:DNA polymerase-3 subunit epsilon
MFKTIWPFKKQQPLLPDFWLEYEAECNKPLPSDIKTARFVVLDTETTGFDFKLDKILSIGAVEVVENQINISNAFEIFIKQNRFNKQTVQIHGIIKNERFETYNEDEAIQHFLKYIKGAIIVAHHAQFDITMINKMLNLHNLPILKNRVLDTVQLYKATLPKSHLAFQNNDVSLDKIAENYRLDVCDRHTAAGDALITALVFLKTTAQLNSKKGLTLAQLFKL